MENSYTAYGMLRQLFADASPGRQLILLVILMGTGLILVSFIAMLLAALIFNIPFSELQSFSEADFQTRPLGLMRFFQVFQTLGLFLVPALIADRLFFTPSASFLQKRPVHLRPISIVLFLVLLISIPFMEQLIQWNRSIHFPAAWKNLDQAMHAMEENRSELTQKMLAATTGGSLVLNIFIMAALPALAEEFLFRGVLQTVFVKWFKNAHIGILLTSVVFSAFHLQFYGFFPRLLLGVFFGYTFYWSRNIWIPVLAHFFNNLLAVVFAFLSAREWGEQLQEMPVRSWITVLFSMISSLLLLYALRGYLLREKQTV